ncbi:NmrA family NAD(P)-binding protein [Mucilaginibacter celer]|uniref:NAD-dependent epimerase/dehydratase family protein n=1 Tax=Mucilaginibacter celer TaxID=2305508 RepID=A0A494VK68_9SPHI|nr:NmrA family NAD(P)-binding protein [Mucilaginibacter celer]AYL94319.1 NAD-dependent epimerase/dehydratase family protein [Mucilaginibacter celer]
MDAKILITGATGISGENTIERLLQLQEPVRAMVRKADSRTDALAGRGVEIVEGDMSDFDSVSAALKGIEYAYFTYPVHLAGLLEASAYFAQAALEENVSLIVNLSHRSARRMARSRSSRDHWFAERIFDRSGVPVTHLRPTLFSEWLAFFSDEIKTRSRLAFPFKNTFYAPLAGEDIGRVIASILLNPEGHKGQIYPLFGPVELSHFEMADILSATLNRTIHFETVDEPEFISVMERARCTPHFIRHMCAMTYDIQDGMLSGTSDWVERITGRKPMSLKDFVKKNSNLF